MVNSNRTRQLIAALLFGVLTTGPSLAQEVGESVRIHGTVAEDTYAAGGTVDVQANVAGDAVVAGGRITVSETIRGDLMAAGGTVSVSADVADDARLIGGDITLRGRIGDDVLAAGGNVTLVPDGEIGGRAWFAGGRVEVAGTVGKGLKATGGLIVLSGRIAGDVVLTGQSIEILDSTVIDGKLFYRSPEEAEIAEGAQINGGVSFEPVEKPEVPVVAAIAGLGIILLLTLMVTGSALFLICPRFVATSLVTLHAEPWKSLGLGLAMFAATPVVISVLFITVVGWLLALVLGALYLILLLAGFLTGVFYLAAIGFGLLKSDAVSNAKRLLTFTVAIVLVMLLGLIPLLGTLLLFIIMLFGVGTLSLSLYRIYITDSGASSG